MPGHVWAECEIMEYIYDIFSIRSITMENINVSTQAVHEIFRFEKRGNLIG